jgi:arginyl-tRNA synthetase
LTPCDVATGLIYDDGSQIIAYPYGYINRHEGQKMSKLGIKAALRNLVEVASNKAVTAVYPTDDDRKAMVEAISTAVTALAVSEIRKLKLSQSDKEEEDSEPTPTENVG